MRGLLALIGLANPRLQVSSWALDAGRCTSTNAPEPRALSVLQ